MFLNEILVKLPDSSSEEPFFHISNIDRVYSLKTENINERCTHTHTQMQLHMPHTLLCRQSHIPLSLLTVCCPFCRTAWVQKIKAACEDFFQMDKKKRAKAYQGRPPHTHAHTHQ